MELLNNREKQELINRLNQREISIKSKHFPLEDYKLPHNNCKCSICMDISAEVKEHMIKFFKHMKNGNTTSIFFITRENLDGYIKHRILSMDVYTDHTKYTIRHSTAPLIGYIVNYNGTQCVLNTHIDITLNKGLNKYNVYLRCDEYVYKKRPRTSNYDIDDIQKYHAISNIDSEIDDAITMTVSEYRDMLDYIRNNLFIWIDEQRKKGKRKKGKHKKGKHKKGKRKKGK